MSENGVRNAWRAASRGRRFALGFAGFCAVLIVLLIVMVAVDGGDSDGDSDRSARSNAEVLCRTAVQQRVPEAGYSDFHSVAVVVKGDAWVVSGEVEGANAVGGRARAVFSCDVDGDSTDAEVSVNVSPK